MVSTEGEHGRIKGFRTSGCSTASMWGLFGHSVPVLCNYSKSVQTFFTQTEQKICTYQGTFRVVGVSLEGGRASEAAMNRHSSRTLKHQQRLLISASSTPPQSVFVDHHQVSNCFTKKWFVFDLCKASHFLYSTLPTHLPTFFFLIIESY